MDTDNKVSD